MLYPDKNKNESGKLNAMQQKEVNKAHIQINAYYEANKLND